MDITFRDVDVNWHQGTQGGRPRLESEAEAFGGQGRRYYTSQNTHSPDLPYKWRIVPIFK